MLSACSFTACARRFKAAFACSLSLFDYGFTDGTYRVVKDIRTKAFDRLEELPGLIL